MGGAVSAGESNDDLIDNLLEAEYIKSPGVERVFRAVDRAHYLTPEFKDNAYKDLAWKSGNLHLSAPCIYSEVMESLKLTSGLSFLNLGSGTGYLSTMAGLMLGPYGVNHGVEIHGDVVQYANTKLEWFWSKSSALDEYEFCKPIFVKGNCLNLTPGNRRYDRVYCGAACPQDQERYMKNLLNVGGILVMPLNDQLLRCTRTSENTWEDRAVLPVSFASLLSVETNASANTQIKLPDNEPLSLQDACRGAIRCCLRKSVDLEHPNLVLRNVRQPKRRIRRRAVRRRLVIPVFEDSDGEGPAVQEFELGNRVPTPTDLVYSVQRERTGQIMAVIEMGRRRGSGIITVRQTASEQSSVDDDRTDDEGTYREGMSRPAESAQEGQSSGSATIAEQRKKVPKREKFDSGLGEEMENGKGLTSESDDGGEMDVDEDSDSSCRPSTEPSEGERSSRVENHDENSREGSGLSRSPESPMWKRVAFMEGEEESDEHSGDSLVSSEADRRSHTISEHDEIQPEVNTDTYTYYMKRKIEVLPLPAALKQFINFYREF